MSPPPNTMERNAPAAQTRSGAGHLEEPQMPGQEYKRCASCGETKPLGDFYREAKARDGRHSYCKECSRARARESKPDPERRAATLRRWREDNPERIAEHARKHRRAAPPEKAAAAARRHRARHPIKARARHALHKAVETGRIRKPTRCGGCSKPFESHLLHGHHADYSKPLNVEWLCRACHLAEHGKTLRLPPGATDG